MQRQGQVDADGTPVAKREPQRAPRQKPQAERGSSVVQFAREVREELLKVNWPTRLEVVNSSAVVLITLVLLVGLIFLLDYLFAKGVVYLFKA